MESSLPLWIVEDCTWPMMWGVLLLALFVFIWFLSRQFLALVAAFAVGGLLIATIFLEMSVVTDKEQVIDAVYTMAEAVTNNDPEGIVQFIDPENESFQQRVRLEMKRYEFRSCHVNGISRVEVDGPNSEPRLAKVDFAVWASASYKGRLETLQSVIVAVQLEFVKKNDRWYVQAYGYRPGNALGKIELVR